MPRLDERSGIRITPRMLGRTFALMALRQGMYSISLQRHTPIAFLRSSLPRACNLGKATDGEARHSIQTTLLMHLRRSISRNGASPCGMNSILQFPARATHLAADRPLIAIAQVC